WNVGGIVLDVIYENRTPRLRRPAHDALAHLDSQASDQFAGMAEAEMHAQLLCLLVEEKNGEDLVINGALDDLRDTGQQLIEIERGIELLADLDHQGQELRQLERPGCGATGFYHGRCAGSLVLGAGE